LTSAVLVTEAKPIAAINVVLPADVGASVWHRENTGKLIRARRAIVRLRIVVDTA